MVKEDLKIEIRPIPGRNGIREFSENLEFFSQAHIIAPFVNPSTRKYSTGLTEEDKEYLAEIRFPYNIDDNYTQNVPHEFWESPIVKVELRNTPMFLFPGKNPIDFIKWKYLLVNSYIYKSEEEMLTGSKPEATHYIYNESVENRIKASAIDKKNALVRSIAKLSAERKRKILLVLLNEDTKLQDDEYLTIRFDDVLSSKELTEQLEELLKRSVDAVDTAADVKSAIHQNVLRRTRQGIFYFETNLGLTEEDVVTFLLNPANQEILLTIKTKIK